MKKIMSDAAQRRIVEYLAGEITTTNGSVPKSFEDPAPDMTTDGQSGAHAAYWVLSESERAKGFVRPVRRAYVHVGIPGPVHPTRPLTPEEHVRHNEGNTDPYAQNYVLYEQFPEGGTALGRFWTQADLDRVGKGCGLSTTMGTALAETYAARPGFYGATFCVGCNKHFPVGAHGEFVWTGSQGAERVGT